MLNAKGFSRSDLIACIAVGVVVASVTSVWGQPGTGSAKIIPWKNLVRIASATAQFQNDHGNRVPIVPTYRRGTVYSPTSGSGVGICSWAWGGKNNSATWAGIGSGLFDVEAADRPMNPYLYPDHPFTAPDPPATLPANDPRRLEEAFLFRDPSDHVTRQRNWPNPTPGISCYDDVGTSYHALFPWFGTMGNSFLEELAEGNRRIAEHDGVDPARFVWLGDQSVDIVPQMQNPSFQLVNGYGDINKGSMLYLDGHVGYESLTPRVLSTARYTLKFE